jgi:hypothetical protein
MSTSVVGILPINASVSIVDFPLYIEQSVALHKHIIMNFAILAALASQMRQSRGKKQYAIVRLSELFSALFCILSRKLFITAPQDRVHN